MKPVQILVLGICRFVFLGLIFIAVNNIKTQIPTERRLVLYGSHTQWLWAQTVSPGLDHFSQGGWVSERENEWKIRKNASHSIYHSLFSHHPPAVQGRLSLCCKRISYPPKSQDFFSLLGVLSSLKWVNASHLWKVKVKLYNLLCFLQFSLLKKLVLLSNKHPA